MRDPVRAAGGRNLQPAVLSESDATLLLERGRPVRLRWPSGYALHRAYRLLLRELHGASGHRPVDRMEGPGRPPARPALRFGALAEGERPLRVTVARGHQVPVLPRIRVEDRERAEAAVLLAGLDHRHRDAVEAPLVHARVEVARVADRPPHDVD